MDEAKGEPSENADHSAPHADPSVVLVEVQPGIAVVFGDVPADLELELIDFGLVSEADRLLISNALAAAGNTATVAGNLGVALANMQGLYRVSEGTQALLAAGAKLAVKDGANLGTVISSTGLSQARFIPVTALTAAQTAAAIGPAVATIALQIQLNEISRLVKTNIALTTGVLAVIRREQWAELTGLISTIDRVIERARETGAVTPSLWSSIAGKEADLQKQLDLYRQNVRAHIEQIEGAGARTRREYLQTNGQPILFDVNALLGSVKAWTGYQALHAGIARANGRDNPDEARLVEVIARDTRSELDQAREQTRTLVDALAHELRLVAELPGRGALSESLRRQRGDLKSARNASSALLEAITPLAVALHPPPPPLEEPELVCAEGEVRLEPYLRVLRWFLDDDERVRVLAIAEATDGQNIVATAVGSARDRLASARDRSAMRTLIAVTDRRIITAHTNDFLEIGKCTRNLSLDLVRYVRMARRHPGGRAGIDLITKGENIGWQFHASVPSEDVRAFASVLAESMSIPDEDRDLLRIPTANADGAEEVRGEPVESIEQTPEFEEIEP